MSHFIAVKTKFSDKETIIQALRNMGFNPEIRDNGTNLNNKWGTTDVANIIVRREQLGVRCGADLGFKQTESGYELTADDYEMNKSSYPNFKQDLGTEYACLIAQRKGYKIISRERVNGKTQVRLAPPQTTKVRR